MIRLLLPLALLAAAAAPAAPAAAESKRARSVGSLADLISNRDYPAAALRAHEQGSTRFRLDVAKDGRVAACTVTASSGSASLDEATCRIMRERALFKPARNARNRPVEDQVNQTITWRIEEVETPPEVDAATEAWLRCLDPHVMASLADAARPARAIAEQAISACRAEEDRLLALVADTMGEPAPGEQQRADLRAEFIEAIEAARSAPRP
ncbi:MAG TPA: energy transducer TonB [Allosphingosinicella sp.]|nr:energy transducer TonB [Allosphingosinicella sp.]